MTINNILFFTPPINIIELTGRSAYRRPLALSGRTGHPTRGRSANFRSCRLKPCHESTSNGRREFSQGGDDSRLGDVWERTGRRLRVSRFGPTTPTRPGALTPTPVLVLRGRKSNLGFFTVRLTTCLLSRRFVSWRRLEVSRRIRGKGSTQLHLTDNINVEAQPHEIDIEFIAGPEAGNWNFGIFRLAGDQLELCLDLNGKPRPTEFCTSPGSGHAYERLIRSYRAAGERERWYAAGAATATDQSR